MNREQAFNIQHSTFNIQFEDAFGEVPKGTGETPVPPWEPGLERFHRGLLSNAPPALSSGFIRVHPWLNILRLMCFLRPFAVGATNGASLAKKVETGQF
jgi:hypothetical protein